jgi:pyridoxine 5-phosphate synthase
MARLSVNLNRIALLRNSRDIGIPDVLHFARLAITSGAHGITVHPRPDQRHIRASDVRDLVRLLEAYPPVEFNMEGNPFVEQGLAFLPLVEAARPDQVTLVPDSAGQATSDHGWDVSADQKRLVPLVRQLHDWGCRVSLFMDADAGAMAQAKAVGADRVELYTKPYVDAWHEGGRARQAALARFAEAADAARVQGLGVNAGHDLNLRNLPDLVRAIPTLAEVSIGHALTADALEMGYSEAVKAYCEAAGG